MARRWKFESHVQLGVAMSCMGLGDPNDYPSGVGFTWKRPGAPGVVYAHVEQDGIHVPLIDGEEVVDTVEQAEELLTKFVLDEFGEVL